jgi:hypothetical protein
MTFSRTAECATDRTIALSTSRLEPKRGGAFNKPDVQDPEDRHDNRSSPRGYDNDHRDDWVRGRDENATGKPGFDFGNSWRRRDGGLDQRSGSDTQQQRRPERIVVNAKQRRND